MTVMPNKSPEPTGGVPAVWMLGLHIRGFWSSRPWLSFFR
jgi:hypothetical protein